MEIILWIGFYFLTFYALLPALISRIFGFRVFLRGRTEREIALTFDDGPDPVYTPRLLDLLKRYGAKATFFVVGSHAEQWPEIVARIHEEGHVIGIHNYVHHSNWLMRPKTVKRQIFRTSEIIKRITGIRPLYYRPPWGIVNIFDYRRLGHLQVVLWTSIFGDWRIRLGADRLYRRMRGKLRPGEVFVLHDCGRTFGANQNAPANMIQALEGILQDGRQAGYRFVGVDEMIRLTEENVRASREGEHATPVSEQPKSGHSELDSGVPRQADSATPPQSGPAAPQVHRIGLLKKISVNLWLGWERIFHFLFHLQPVGDGTSFNYRIRKYSGPVIELKDGKRVKPGNYVMELHFDNRMLFAMGMNSRSSVHTAIRLIREMEGGLPDLARALEGAPHGDQVVALYGISMIHRGAEGLGYETFEMPKGIFSWLTNLYLKFMISVIQPEGKKHVRQYGDRLAPRMIVMERDVLLSWKDRTGRQRPSRSSRTKLPEPAGSRESGMPVDQVGRMV